MQKVLTLLAVFFLAVVSLNAQSARRVEVYFTHGHTQSDLSNIKAELAAQKIMVEYVHTAFDAEGHLSQLEFNVTCPDGQKGSAKSTDVPHDTQFGFFYDPRPEAKTSLSVGMIK